MELIAGSRNKKLTEDIEEPARPRPMLLNSPGTRKEINFWQLELVRA